MNEADLPALVLFEQYSGDWARYLEAIYKNFKNDFILSRPKRYNHKKWLLKRLPLIQGKEATFWHFISEGRVESERLPDMRRCERIRWPRPIIDAAQLGKAKVWRNKRHGQDRIVIAIDDFSYVVILEERKDYVLPWTAYCVEMEHRKRSLRAEYQQFIAKTLVTPSE